MKRIILSVILLTATALNAAVLSQTVVTDPNGVVLAPTNFAVVNGLAKASDLARIPTANLFGPIDGTKTPISNVPLGALSSYYLSNIVYSIQASSNNVTSFGATGGSLSWTNNAMLLTPYPTNTSAQALDIWLSTGQPYNTNYWWTLSMDVMPAFTNEGIWFYLTGSAGNGYEFKSNNLPANSWTHLSSTFPGSASSSVLSIYVTTNGVVYPVNITNQANTVAISNFTIVASTNYNPFAQSTIPTTSLVGTIDGSNPNITVTNIPISAVSSFTITNTFYTFQPGASTAASMFLGGTSVWTNSSILLTPFPTNAATHALGLVLYTGQPYNSNYWWTLSMDVMPAFTNEGIWFSLPGSIGNTYALKSNNLPANAWTHLSSTFPGSASSSTLYTYVASNGVVYPLDITNQANTVIFSNYTVTIFTNYTSLAFSGINPTNMTPRVILPSEIVGVVGDELQVYTRSVIEAQTPYALPYQITCPVGAAYPRYFDLTPIAPSTNTLTFSVMDETGASLASNTTSLICVSNRVAPATTKNVLCVGDSLTSGGEWASEFYRRLTQSGGTPAGNGYANIQFIGNQAMSAYPTQKFVGYGGWTWDIYLNTYGNTASWLTVSGSAGKDATDQKSVYKDASGNLWQIETIQTTQIKMIPSGWVTGYSMPSAPNTLTWVSGGTHTGAINYTAVTADATTPFWNGSQFSFSGFCTTNGYTNIDIVYVLLGWNGLNTPNKPNAVDHTNQTVKAQQFITQLHADYPNAQVRIMGIEVPSTSGGLGANYGANSPYSTYYNVLRSANGLRLAYQTLTTNSFVKYIDVAATFDSENNMLVTTNAVNTRNTTTELRGSNGVHPATQGYMQIADAAWRDFVRTYCQ